MKLDAIASNLTQKMSNPIAKKTEYGKTIGDAKLSETGAKYYEELKKKYNNMDFILVSEDQKDNAQANAAQYANPAKMVVLIDEEKVEKMATDENFRSEYETKIQNAQASFSQIKEETEAAGLGDLVKGYGMQVNDDGSTSFFAVLKQSSAAQKKRIEKKAAENKEAKKAADKKAQKEAQKESFEKAKASRTEKNEKYSAYGKDKLDKTDSEKTVTITAASVEELLKKISDYGMEYRSNNVLTEGEKYVGRNIDFSL